MEALLGGPVKRYTDQTIFKPSVFKAGRSFYYQDCFYWKLRPNVCLNCWIALDEVAPDAMALGFLSGTHARWRIQFHEQYWDQVPRHGRDGRASRRHARSSSSSSTSTVTMSAPEAPLPPSFEPKDFLGPATDSVGSPTRLDTVAPSPR